MTLSDFHITRGKYAWIWLGLLGMSLLLGNARIGLWDQDEAAYAGFGRRMIETGDWLVPQFTWSDVHRKPPLHFWGIAASQSVFGQNAWATRLPGALAVWLTCSLLWVLGGKLFTNVAVGRWAAMILGTSFLTNTLGHIAFTDSTLLLCQTLAAIALGFIVQGKKRWSVVFWVAVGMGLLAKGPPILISMGGLGLLILLSHPEKKHLLTFRFWVGFPLAVFPLLLWGYMSWQRDDGAFVKWLIDWYILNRVDGHVFGQTGPPGYHLAVMLAAFLPWWLLLPSVWQKTRTYLRNRSEPAFFVLMWMIAAWVPYEFVSSKLPTYALAAHPALALLLAYGLQTTTWPFLVRLRPLATRWLAGTLVTLGLIWGLIVPRLGTYKDSSLALAEMLSQDIPDQSSVLILEWAALPPSLPFYLEKDYDLSFTQSPDSIRHWLEVHPRGYVVSNPTQLAGYESLQPLDTLRHMNSGKAKELVYVISQNTGK